MKAKKPASIKAHQRFGALRIGALGDHESVALLIWLDANLRRNVARNGKLLKLPNVRKKRVDIDSQATPPSDVESSQLAGKKLRVSAVQSSITCLLSIPILAIHLPYSIGKNERDSFRWRKLFCRHNNQKQNPVRFRF
jgi:hypothetical protein